jgi:membrane-bound metal-dependent hydrolase YbcI (DUF457 family)
MGHEGYLRVSRGTFSFITSQGLAGTGSQGLWLRITESSRLFDQRYGVSIWTLLILGCLAVWVVWKRGSPPLLKTAVALYVGFVLHSVYWMAFSRGWPRYMVIALVPIALVICLPIATEISGRQVGLVFAILLVCLVPTVRRLGFPLGGMKEGWFQPNERLRRALTVTRYLDDNARGRSVYTQWWAMVAAFEYQARERIRFRPIGVATQRDPREECLVVLDDRWLDRADSRLDVLLEACGRPVIDLAPYRVFRCASTAEPR